MGDGSGRRWGAVFRNALTWGVAWGIVGGSIAGVFALFSSNPGIESLIERVGMSLFAGVSWGVRFGVIGAAMGTVFSSLLLIGYRGRRIVDINPVHFALLGAVVGGVGVPLFLQLMNVLTGGAPIAWNLVQDDAVLAAVFGGAAAGGSIYLARRAEAMSPTAIDSERAEAGALGSGDYTADSLQKHRTEDKIRR